MRVIEYVKKSELKAQKKLSTKLRKKISELKKAKSEQLSLKIKQKKDSLKAEISRRKLLMGLRDKVMKQKRPVAIMRKIEDKIPSAFSEDNSMLGNYPKKQRPTFLD